MKEMILRDGRKTLLDDDDFELFNRNLWGVNSNGYARRGVGKRAKTLLLHRLVIDAPEGMFVDHINCDKLDNRKSNLRLCTSSQNKMNVGLKSNNTTGYKGVSFRKDRNKYRASIELNGKTFRLGTYTDPVEAAKAYDEAAKRLFGEFARLNFP